MKELLEAHFQIFPFLSLGCNFVMSFCFLIAARKNLWSRVELLLGFASALAVLCHVGQLAGMNELKYVAEGLSILAYLGGVLLLALRTPKALH